MNCEICRDLCFVISERLGEGIHQVQRCDACCGDDVTDDIAAAFARETVKRAVDFFHDLDQWLEGDIVEPSRNEWTMLKLAHAMLNPLRPPYIAPTVAANGDVDSLEVEHGKPSPPEKVRKAPEWAWEIIDETLSMDAQSSAFDSGLRDSIRSALEAMTEVE